jgi:hypothetical protein
VRNCITVVFALSLLTGCEREPAEQLPKRPTASEGAPAPGAAPTEHTDETRGVSPSANAQKTVTAYVRTVDRQDHPVAGMMPIATERPNAFDEPLASGLLTNAEGKTVLEIPAGKHVYVRGWDPHGEWFANNYFEIMPAEGNATKEMKIEMVRGGLISARALTAQGDPVADSEARMMMFHPHEGPWWPAQNHTDADGYVLFGPVPAGVYLLRLAVENVGTLEVPEVAVPPEGQINLGDLVFQ